MTCKLTLLHGPLEAMPERVLEAVIQRLEEVAVHSIECTQIGSSRVLQHVGHAAALQIGF